MSVEQPGPIVAEAVPQKTSYLQEVLMELSKTTWPTRPEALKLTYIVIGVIVVLGIYMGIMDVALGAVFARILHHG